MCFICNPGRPTNILVYNSYWTIALSLIKLTKKLLEELNPILANYSKDKSLSIIIDKKNVVIGKKDLDITNEILELLNEKIKEIVIE